MRRASEQVSAQRWRVVVIEDDPVDLAEYGRLLSLGSGRRYDFIEATSGAAGIAAVLEAPGGPPDCVILDYRLPDCDAVEVLAALAGPGGTPVCPVVVCTGQDEPEIERAALRAGAHDFVGKGGMTARTLTRAVEHAVERWTMARELQASESRLRLALNASRTGIWTRDLLSGAVTWSPEVYAIYGIAEGDYEGTLADFFRHVHPDDHALLAAQGRASLTDPSSYQLEFRMIRPDGGVVWVQSLGQAIHDASGKPLWMVGTIRDVTARHEAEAALRVALDQAQRAVRTRDELVSLVSHDLKNPLHTLVMGISMLTSKPGGEDQPILTRMARQARRMNSMVDELLDAVQLYEGQPLALQLQTTDLVQVVRTLARMSQEASPKHPIAVRAAVDALAGWWDPVRIERVVNNLLSNAVKYSPGGGAIRVELEATVEEGRRWACLRVADQGMGIPTSDQARIFEWYSRGENALQTTIPGTGIGLSGARDIVALHGGTIAVASEVGKGSTFTVRLPVDPPPPVGPSP